MRRGLSPINSRKLPVMVVLLGMVIFTVVAAETPSGVLAVAAISAALMFGAAASAMSWALSSVAAPANCSSIAWATGSFAPALLVSAAIGLVSALSYLFVVRGEPITTAELSSAG